MGVHGWSHLLRDHGWIPDARNKDNETSLWMEQEEIDRSHHSSLLEDRLVEILPGSDLHIDAVCLCFHIHQIAYARHCQQVLKTKNSSKTKHKKKNFKAHEIRHMIPSFLPPALLTQVTQEFVQTLGGVFQLNLIVYWDGDLRYAPTTGSADNEADDPPDLGRITFKQKTEEERQARRADEWSVLEDYIVHAKIPTGKDFQKWQSEFPKNRLFITQVMHALLDLKVSMKFCDEEADSVMARAAMGNDKAYILGLDSDFCFFPNVSYIPINTLTISSSHTREANKPKWSFKAIVIRRDILAQSLKIPDSTMIELAILMGNDYVKGIESFDLPVRTNDRKSGDNDEEDLLPTRKQLMHRDISQRTQAFLRLLQHQGEGFQIQSSFASVQKCLEFIRRLYNLQDMSIYTMETTVYGTEPSLPTAAIGMTEQLGEKLRKATIDPSKGDSTLKDAVLRYLRMIRRHQKRTDEKLGGDPRPEVLTQSHISAFEMLTSERPPYSEIDVQIKDASGWRPSWQDIAAVYWIERIINSIVHNVIQQRNELGKNNSDNSGLAAPGDVFDPYLYHASLQVAREAQGSVMDEQVMSDEIEVAPEPQEAESVQGPKQILDSVKRNRVTIIQGDTGCGKSSRIPVLLLNAPPPNPMQTETKLFISQPRRIAAKALVERLRNVEPSLKDQIALRMGHGVREYENNMTRAWFVTTGYLVRLLANHPERFDDISVLIVDEVHERSVDTDILCLLCRRLLATNEHIRLVLMSATLAAEMYQRYFGVPDPPIRVGARRFPVQEVYLDNLAEKVRLSAKDAKKASELYKECLAMKCKKPPSMQYMEKVYTVVANLATVIGIPGSSVLIFVPGMNDIVAITEIIESTTVAGTRFTCVPIHSDIPFEDQMLVFDASKQDEVKIVIATNAAESSLTLPEVDNVICLGLCKQIVYNQASHRQMLTPTWISKASATQRAGRTGRVRPGTVYRIYPKQSFERDMQQFEQGEMLRIPLDSVILMLKDMLVDEKVSEVLLSCLEPPDITVIDRSFQSLHKAFFITTPDDCCELTSLGAFVSSLGIDLALGSLIGLGIQMGIGPEAIEMAAILSFPKSPWIQSNPLVHPTRSFNDNTVKSFVSRCHFDANLFSEPLGIMNLIWEYERQKDIYKWAKFNNIFIPRMRRLASTTVNLRKRVADFLGISETSLEVRRPPWEMDHGMVTMLRIIQLWVFHDTTIQFNQKTLHTLQKKYTKNGLCLEIQQKSDTLERAHLEQIFVSDRHLFSLRGSSEIRHKGDFEYIQASSTNMDFTTRLESHLLSYTTENHFCLLCVSFRNSLLVYTSTERESSVVEAVTEHLAAQERKFIQATLLLRSNQGKPARGIGERSCGKWKVEIPSDTNALNSDSKTVSWIRYGLALPAQELTKKEKTKQAKKSLSAISSSLERISRAAGDDKCMFLAFPWSSDDVAPDSSFKFSLCTFGSTSPVNPVDMKDMLGPRVDVITKTISGKQKINLELSESKPRRFKAQKDSPAPTGPSSWDRPLFKCVPEAARVVSVLLSNRRRENVIKFVPTKTEMEEPNDDDEVEELCAYFDKTTDASFRWKRCGTDDAVYIDANTVPATAVPLNDSSELFCVCANTLEVRGGGLRAEGLTLLPQGGVFLLLARLTFGLFPEENGDDDTIIENALRWIGGQTGSLDSLALENKIQQAVDFHESAINLGEALECFPDKVAVLLEIFDGVDGYATKPWDDLQSNPLTRNNLILQRGALKRENTIRFYKRESGSGVDALRNGVKPMPNGSTNEGRNQNEQLSSSPPAKPSHDASREGEEDEAISPKNFVLVSLSQEDIGKINDLFNGTNNECDIGSCKRLAEVHPKATPGGDTLSIDSTDWQIFQVEADEAAKVWYKAVFAPRDVEYKTSKKITGSAAWLRKKTHWAARPRNVSHAMSCVPPAYRTGSAVRKARIKTTTNTNANVGPKNILIFDDLKLAVQMEAAFWLERQFRLGDQHWYDRTGGVDELVAELAPSHS